MPSVQDIALVFRSGWGPAAAAGIVLVACALAYIWNRPTRSAVSGGTWRALAVLQTLAALLLALWLVNPRLRIAQETHSEGSVAIVIDASRSMAATDAGEGRSRYDAARELLAAPQSPLRESLAKKAGLVGYVFDANLRAQEGADAAENNNHGAFATDLAATFKSLREQVGAKNLRGVVLAGDGRDTAGGNWRAAAKELGVPVYAIGVGARDDPAAWRNAGIASIDAPPRGGYGAKISLRAQIAQEGFAGASIAVRLEQNGKTLATQTLALGPDPTGEAIFEFAPEATGTQTYEIAIAPPPGDAMPQDDRQAFSVLVSDRVLRVLYAEGRLRWVYQTLRRALAREKSIELDSVVCTGPGRFLQQGPTKLALRNLLPAENQLREYDVVILGDITPELLPPDDARMLERFVKEKKGGLLVIGGDGILRSRAWQDSPLAALLPAALDPAAGLWSPESGAQPRIAAAGQNAAALAGLGDYLGSLALGRVFPIGAAKPGAEVWLEAGAPNPRALMSAQRYGEGRTILLASDDFWRTTARASGEETSGAEKFWIQAVHWCAGMDEAGGKDDPLVMAATDKSHYEPGEAVALTALVRKASGAAANETFSAQGIISRIEPTIDPAKPAARVALESFNPGQPDDKNELRRNWLPLGEGDYAITLNAERGVEKGTTECRFTVGRPAEELAPRGIDEDALRTLARLTGGAYYGPLEARRIADDIERSRSAGRAVVETDLVDSPWLFGAFCLCVGTGWTLRRRKNLI